MLLGAAVPHLVLQVEIVHALHDCSIVDTHTHAQQQEAKKHALLLQAAALEQRAAQAGGVQGNSVLGKV